MTHPTRWLSCQHHRLICLALASIAAAQSIDSPLAQALEPLLPANPVAIHRTVVEPARAEAPRSDTASVVELSPGNLLMVYHRYRASELAGSDFGPCSIWCQTSSDGGYSWSGTREIIKATEGDINVQAPALCRLPDGNLLMLANHAQGRSSTTMRLYRSADSGRSWTFDQLLWERSEGQWLQGGNSQLLRLSQGRLIFGVHGGTGSQSKQKNDAWCMFSDDDGHSWHRSQDTIRLPMRGAMEASLAELPDGQLLMSLRTQLGGPFLTRSTDHGQTWSPAQPTGLVGPESSTCLRTIPGTSNLILIWNGSMYEQDHHHYGQRTPLSIAMSLDQGQRWTKVADLETDQNAEFTNLDCLFTSSGDAIVTYAATRPAWERKEPAMSLVCAVVPREFFVQHTRDLRSR